MSSSREKMIRPRRQLRADMMRTSISPHRLSSFPRLFLLLALLGAMAFGFLSVKPASAQGLPMVSITCPAGVPAVAHNADRIGAVECTLTASSAPAEPVAVKYRVSGSGGRSLQYEQSVSVTATVTTVPVEFLLDSTSVTVRLLAGSGYNFGNPREASIAVGQAPLTGAGLKVNDEGALDGYLLLTGARHNRFYLMDNEGREAYRWDRTAQLGKLLDSGNLLTLDQWTNMAEIKPNGTAAWEQTEGTEHHDVLKLANGNYLFIDSTFYTNAEAIAAGANPACLGDEGLEIDQVVEVKPSGTSGGTVVWKWSVWDHLIQDFDSDKDNYGVVADHPERIDLNYGLCRLNVASNAFVRDPHHHTHMNSIDYNAELDQILITTRHFSEAWVIDHSTTTAQAAGSAGGNSGMGGDLLYRWGNPRAYKNGTKSDQKVFFPHNAHWIPAGLAGKGNVLIYNNGHEHPGFLRDYATVDEVVFPASGYKYLKAGGAYMPPTPVWTYRLAQRTWILSNAQRLPNGNTLITEGFFGRISEVTQSGSVVWLYVSPLANGTDVLVKNALPGTSNVWVYRAYKYAADHPGIQALTLIPESDRQRIARTNQAPTVASAIADAVIVNETGTHQVSLSGVFEDADNHSLTISAPSSNNAVATASVAADYSSLTVTARSRGSPTITVTANDGIGGTVSDSFTVRVKAAPVVATAISDVDGLQAGTTRDVSLSGVFSDADGDTLTVTAVSSNNAVATVSVSAGYATLTLAGVAQGTATVTVAARDSDGNTAVDQFSVTVGAPPNNVPTVSAPIADVSGLTAGTTREVSLSGVFSDDAGDSLTITAASSNSGIAAVTVAADYTRLTLRGVAEGTATVTVTAQDSDGNRISDAFQVEVVRPPEPESPDGTVVAPIADFTLEGSQVRDIDLTEVFRDPDGQELTFSARSSNVRVAALWSIEGLGGSTLRVVATGNGTATITVTAQDPDGNTARDSFVVTVTPFGGG